MERWMACTAAIFTLAHLGWGCLLTRRGSDYPWLIRIIKMGSSSNGTGGNETVAHGSLVSTDKVLTAAAIRTVVTDEDLDKKMVSLIGYNVEKSCSQTRSVDYISYHWLNQYDYCNLGEFALVFPDGDFVTIEAPFIVSFPYNPPFPTPSEAQLIESMIEDLNNGNESVSVYMFADRNSDTGELADPNGIFPYVPWMKCKEMPNFKEIKGKRDPSATNFTFFCGSSIPGKTEATSASNGMGYDWYMGAPVVFNGDDAEGNSTYGVGIYLFWSGQSGEPHVFATFTQYLFDFIEGKLPRPSPATTQAYTWPTLPQPQPRLSTKEPDGFIPTHHAFSRSPRPIGLPKRWLLTASLIEIFL